MSNQLSLMIAMAMFLVLLSSCGENRELKSKEAELNKIEAQLQIQKQQLQMEKQKNDILQKDKSDLSKTIYLVAGLAVSLILLAIIIGVAMTSKAKKDAFSNNYSSGTDPSQMGMKGDHNVNDRSTSQVKKKKTKSSKTSKDTSTAKKNDGF